MTLERIETNEYWFLNRYRQLNPTHGVINTNNINIIYVMVNYFPLVITKKKNMRFKKKMWGRLFRSGIFRYLTHKK